MCTIAMYTIDELVKAAWKVFNHSGALVAAALEETGITEFSLDEAKEIVEAFAQREVNN